MSEWGQAESGRRERLCGDPRCLGTSQMGQPSHSSRKRFVKPAVSK